MTFMSIYEYLDKYTAAPEVSGRLFLVEYEFLLLDFLTSGTRASSLRSTRVKPGFFFLRVRKVRVGKINIHVSICYVSIFIETGGELVEKKATIF